MGDIIPQIKRVTSDCFRAVCNKIDPNRRQNTFEVFGLDFMLDENFNLYLIEVNTNPVLDMSNPVMTKLIPAMLDNALRLVVDPLFPPPEHIKPYDLCEPHKFELIFDESLDREQSPYLN
jgi:tubulin monoglycylase TTLL3/8